MKFRFTKEVESHSFLIIDSSIDFNVTKDYIINNDIKNICFNEFDGYDSSNYSKYSEIRGIERIEIIGSKIEADELIGFHNLKYLYLSSPVVGLLDLKQFKNLVSLNVEWNKNIQHLNTLLGLSELTVRNFNGNIDELKLSNLKSLNLIQGNLVNLDFLSFFEGLKSISLYGLSKLLDAKGLISQQTTLEVLEIEKCKKVEWGSVLEHLTNLHKLIFSENGELSDIYFIEKLKALVFFSFVDTKIQNGDLRPCLGIDYVGFDNMKHYNYKNVDGKAVN